MMRRETVCNESGEKQGFFSLFLPIVVALMCALIMVFLSGLKFTEMLELRTYDARMREHKVDGAHHADPRIVIIALDERTDNALKEPEMLRIVRYTRVIRALHESGAKVVGFDRIMVKTVDDFVQYGIDEIIARTKGDEEKKRAVSEYVKDYSLPFGCEFGKEIGETGSVIVNMIEEESGLFVGSNDDISNFAGPGNAATATLYPDADGIIRSIFPFLADQDGKSFFSFSFLLASRYMDSEKELRDLTLLKSIPLYRNTLLINYVNDDPRAFPLYSFVDIDAKASSGDKSFLDNHFKGKIVLIGSTTLSSRDLKKTPFNNDIAVYPGVLVHAQAVNTLLHRDYIRRISLFHRILILSVLIFVCFLIGFRLSLGKSIILAIIIGVCYWKIAALLFCRWNLWIDCAAPLMAIPLALISSKALRFIIVEREKNFVRKIFERYVSQNIAEEILKNPCLINLGGEERDITVLFSDINHFTTISETRAPEEIMSALNEYFTLMEEIIFKHQGTLKQFVGDEIMVIFGAPCRQEDHKRHAVLTAIEMVESLDEWSRAREARGEFHFSIKVGVHSGRVVVGNVGSPHRTEYTAVGDAVNTASRIMGLNKTLGTSILISEEIYSDVRDLLETRDEGLHAVKGKGQAIHVYSVPGRKEPAEQSSPAI